MTQFCKANPCCGNLAGDCDVPLPQDASGFPARNTQWSAQIEAGAKSVNQARAMADVSTLPGLPAPKKEMTSVEAFKSATAKITDATEEAVAGMRPSVIKFAEEIKALKPLFDSMTQEHARRAVMFMEVSSKGLGAALEKELQNAFK